MTDLALILPRSSLFNSARPGPSAQFSIAQRQAAAQAQVILQTLEAHAISTTDLLTLSPVEVATRAKLGIKAVEKIRDTVVKEIWADLGFEVKKEEKENVGAVDPALGLSFGGGGASPLQLRKKRKLDDGVEEDGEEIEAQQAAPVPLEEEKVSDTATEKLDSTPPTGESILEEEVEVPKWRLDLDRWNTISTLDPKLDAAFGGGIPAGYVTEVVGESTTGKTTFLLGLLLATQLPPPYGLAKDALYLTTESRMPTDRLLAIMNTNTTILENQDPSNPVSVNRVHTPRESLNDLEVQDHILNYQVPAFIHQRNIGLVVLDSVAANYRAELDGGTEALGARGHELARLGKLLRSFAAEGIAVVVANQVADRFEVRGEESVTPMAHMKQEQAPTPHLPPPSPGPLSSSPAVLDSTPTPLPLNARVNIELPSSAPALTQTQSTKQYTLNSHTMTLDHQQRFFTGWGDLPLSMTPQSYLPPQLNLQSRYPHLQNILNNAANIEQSQNLKTPALGLIWANQIACRVALKVLRGSDGFGFDLDGEEETDEYGNVVNVEKSAVEQQDVKSRRKRRALNIVFAPWVKGTAAVGMDESGSSQNELDDAGEGIEYEIRGDGIHAL